MLWSCIGLLCFFYRIKAHIKLHDDLPYQINHNFITHDMTNLINNSTFIIQLSREFFYNAHLLKFIFMHSRGPIMSGIFFTMYYQYHSKLNIPTKLSVICKQSISCLSHFIVFFIWFRSNYSVVIYFRPCCQLANGTKQTVHVYFNLY